MKRPDPDPATGAVTVPIYQTSTYVQEALGKHKGFEYARTQNPTRLALERNMATLEKGVAGYAFASGMAAITAITHLLLKQGDHGICSDNVYGGTFRLFDKIVKHYGVDFTYVNTSDVAEVERAIRPNTRMVFVETPTNPIMAITDLRAVSDVAHQHGCRVVVDNTFMSPYFQRPIEFGADIVVHSTTKYLTGHGTVVGGAIITPHEAIYREKLLPTLTNYGAVAGPMDAWLTGLGLKTFHLRMPRHCENGLAVAHFLAQHPTVTRVNYPGLPSFPQRDLALAQMDAFGAMMSFELRGGYDAAVKVMNNVRLCRLAVSLGTTDTLIAHPASMMNFKTPPEERLKMGITDSLIRLSVGLEDIEDIIADLDQALTSAH